MLFSDVKTFYKVMLSVLLCAVSHPSDAVVDNYGREFVFALQPYSTYTSVSTDDGYYVAGLIINSRYGSAKGTVTIDGLGVSKNFFVEHGKSTTVTLPGEVFKLPNNQIADLAISVVADNDIAIHANSGDLGSIDSFLALPTSVLGSEYYVLSRSGTNPNGIHQPSQVSIVATENGTEVEITPSVAAIGHSAKVPFKVQLDKGQVYSLIASGTKDLTGTSVRGTSPVGVISGAACAYVLTSYCDKLSTMIPPMESWGTTFLAMPFAMRDTYVLRVLASTNYTKIAVNGVLVATLGAGKYFEMTLNSAAFVESSNPVLVAQYAPGKAYDGVADPLMMLVQSVSQQLHDYKVSTYTDGLTQMYNNPYSFALAPDSFFNLIVPDSDVGSLSIDGVLVEQSAYFDLNIPGYKGVYAEVVPPGETKKMLNSVSLTPGVRHFKADKPFVVQYYGYTNIKYRGSYVNAGAGAWGLPGGLLLSGSYQNNDTYLPNVNLVQQQDDLATVIASDNEDTNGNHILNAGEDINLNGIIDYRSEDLNNNNQLDPGEDINSNGMLDRDAGIYHLGLKDGSENVDMVLGEFAPGQEYVTFSLKLINPEMPGLGVVEVIDGGGNTVTQTIELIAAKAAFKNVKFVFTAANDRNAVDVGSFNTPPDMVHNAGNVTKYIWNVDSFNSTQIKPYNFELIVKEPAPGERHLVASNIELSYLDLNGNDVYEALGPQYVTVLPSVFQVNTHTDHAVYESDTHANITTTLTNLGEHQDTTGLRIVVKDSKGVDVGVVSSIQNVVVQPREVKRFSYDFYTGGIYAGQYEVVAEIINAAGEVVSSSSSDFSIVENYDASVVARVSADKYSYDLAEIVSISGHIENSAKNVTYENLVAKINMYSPDGELFWSNKDVLPQILPASIQDVNCFASLDDAGPGEYKISLTITDSDDELIASSEARFKVNSSADSGAGLVGEIAFDPLSGDILRTEYLNISAGVKNLGNTPVTNLPVTLVLVDPADKYIVAQWDSAVSTLAVQGDYSFSYDWRASVLAGTNYVAVLSAKFGDEQKVLASRKFVISEKIKSVFTKGVTGRLLILMDGEPKCRGGERPCINNVSIRPPQDDSYDVGHDRKKDADRYKPSPEEQRTFLETRLSEQGWSYSIVTNGDDFVREMRSNGYVAYALFSQRQKLDVQALHELRERVYRGEGLLVAGLHDEQNGHLDSSLGIRVNGKYTNVNSFTLLESPLSLTGDSHLAYSENAMRVEPVGAEVAARFDFKDCGHNIHVAGTVREACVGTDKGKHKNNNAAVTTYQYGLGHSVYAAFDLLAQAAAIQDENLLDDLLAASLVYSHPQDLETIQMSVVPLSLVVTNMGRYIDGRVLITLPEDVLMIDPGNAVMDTDGKAVWAYGLGSDESAKLDFWVSFPDTLTNLTFSAVIQTGHDPAWEDYGVTELHVRPSVYPGLYDVISDLSSLLDQNWQYRKALSELQHADRAMQHNMPTNALNHMLKATDALSRAKHERAGDIRVMVDNVIALYAQRLPTHGKDPGDKNNH